jgi:hypothetical protein
MLGDILPAHGQTVPDSSLQTPPKVIVARHTNPHAPKLDGKLDDAVWQTADFIDDFLQKDPVEGGQPTDRTEVAVIYDDKNLYIGARCYSSDPGSLRMHLDRRDRHGPAELFIVSIDSYFDRRTAYGFGVNTAGVQIDRYNPDDDEGWRDYTFDPVWVARTAVDSVSWTLEMRIPFSQLRFNDKPEQTWGINFNRWIPERNEDVFWVYVPRQERGWSSHFGHLKGLQGIKPSRRLEVLPYISSNLVQEKGKNPFNDPVDKSNQFGGDLKMGLGPNMTLDATINPDFGQVEADPAVVNLSDFEVFFPERRPFFLESRQLLEGDGPGYYFSRRIGGNSRILGAGKVTGRMQSGMSTGLLMAVSERKLDPENAIDEPTSFYGVGRVQQQFGPNQSTAGLLGTAVARDLSPSLSLENEFRSRAYSGGGDWTLRFRGGEMELSGYVGASHIEGSKEAILLAQESSARYYQRPDAAYIQLDSNRTSLTGYTANLALNKRSGRHWLWGVQGSTESPAFELNDAGRLGKADDLDLSGWLMYRNTVPGAIFRDYRLEVSSYGNWNYGGIRQFSEAQIFASGTFRNYYQAWSWLAVQPAGQNHSQTRGGPTMKRESGHSFGGGLGNGFTRKVQWEVSYRAGFDNLDGWLYDFGGNLSARVGNRVQLSVSPSYRREDQPRQYVETITSAGGGADTYGARYVFSRIAQTTMSANLRVNYFFTPDLSLEVFAQPFAASGRYYKHGELIEAGGNDLRVYEDDSSVTVTDEPDGSFTVDDGGQVFNVPYLDFNVLSMRSNVVLRWQFRPGSTVYLVWQQNLSQDQPITTEVGPGSLWDSFSSGGQNFFAFKIAYWIPVS